MRRLAAIIALGLALPVLVVFGLGADGESGSGYEVRAIFDNVASAVPGEDVKVAGAKIGVIKSMDVTKDKKAAVVLQIDDARFTPFHADAKCTVRPQSLIGEKFVECNPGTAASPALARIGGRRPAPAAAEADQLAGGPGPDQQHQPPPLPRAAVDPDQRVRHRPGRPRRRT